MEQKIFTQKTKEEVLIDLEKSPDAYLRYLGLNEEWQNLFMAFCTGKKTLPVLYDTVFKKLMNPETHRDRLEDCVSSLLGRKVKIRKVLPVEDIMMDGETIMVLDILVELKDGPLVLVEIQKVPYYFPAERASCYSADLLLRQYSSIKSKKGKLFSYKDLRKVYTIVIYEKSTEEFKSCSDTFVHHARTICDTGLELNFLQEFYLIALDVFAKSEYAKVKKPKDRLNGWLSFFCTENTEDAVRLCETYPWLSEPYKEMARFAANPEELMGMFSQILRELDHNTTRYMVDDMKDKIKKQGQTIAEQQEALAKKDEDLAEKDEALAKKDEALAEKDEALVEKDEALAEKDMALAEKDMALARRDGTIAEQQRTISEQKAALEAMEAKIKHLLENSDALNQG